MFQGGRATLPVEMPEHVPCPHIPTFHLHTATWLLQEVLAAMLVVPHLEAPTLLSFQGSGRDRTHPQDSHAWASEPEQQIAHPCSPGLATVASV